VNYRLLSWWRLKVFEKILGMGEWPPLFLGLPVLPPPGGLAAHGFAGRSDQWQSPVDAGFDYGRDVLC
jgi:hypothetical protein